MKTFRKTSIIIATACLLILASCSSNTEAINNTDQSKVSQTSISKANTDTNKPTESATETETPSSVAYKSEIEDSQEEFLKVINSSIRVVNSNLSIKAEMKTSDNPDDTQTFSFDNGLCLMEVSGENKEPLQILFDGKDSNYLKLNGSSELFLEDEKKNLDQFMGDWVHMNSDDFSNIFNLACQQGASLDEFGEGSFTKIEKITDNKDNVEFKATASDNTFFTFKIKKNGERKTIDKDSPNFDESAPYENYQLTEFSFDDVSKSITTTALLSIEQDLNLNKMIPTEYVEYSDMT